MSAKASVLALTISLLGAGMMLGGDAPETLTPDQRRTKVNTYLDQRKPQEAVKFLEEIIREDPKDGASYARLGLIHALILRDKEKAIPFLTKGWELGDVNGLEGLATVILLNEERDKDLLVKYRDDFLKRFTDFKVAKGVVFYYAATEKNRELFDTLVKQVSVEEIEKDSSLATMIARAAKALAE